MRIDLAFCSKLQVHTSSSTRLPGNPGAISLCLHSALSRDWDLGWRASHKGPPARPPFCLAVLRQYVPCRLMLQVTSTPQQRRMFCREHLCDSHDVSSPIMARESQVSPSSTTFLPGSPGDTSCRT